MSPMVTGACACGRYHEPATRLDLAEGALDRLASVPELGAGRQKESGGHLLVLMDENTERVAGSRVVSVLSDGGHLVKQVVLRPRPGGHTSLEPDDDAVFQCFEAMASKPSAVVSVGSGTVTDLGRFLASRFGVPQVAVATAASMDGYTSSVSPLVFRGFKRTYPCAPPVAVVGEPSTLAGAPTRMTQAGLGDLLGKYTANADWLVANEAFGEYRCQAVWDGLKGTLESCIGALDLLAASDPCTVAGLARGLMDSGTAIMYVGNSRPASGAEHLISHAWEMMAIRQGAAQNLHGAQVGVAAVMVSRLYERILGLEPADVGAVSRGVGAGAAASGAGQGADWRDSVAAAFGEAALGEVLRETGARDRSPEGRRDRLARLAAVWDAMRQRVGALLPGSAALAGVLRGLGAPATPSELGIPAEWVGSALRNAHCLRNRYTAINLAEDLGLLDDWAESEQARA